MILNNTDPVATPTSIPHKVLLASTPVQASEQGNFNFDFEDNSTLGNDVDIISIYEDFYGIPWEEFSTGTTPPAFFAVLIDRLKSLNTSWEKPVYLSLGIVQGEGPTLVS